MNAVVETRDMPSTVIRLGWVSFLTDVSSEMIVSLLPAFLATLPGAAALALGWIEGVAEATASGVKVVSGRLTDRARARKPLVLLGYGLSSVVRPLIALAGSWVAVLVIRFFDRIGKGVRSAPRDTLIAAVTPPERRGAAFGLHRAFDNAGAVLGPLVATGLMLGLGVSMRGVFALAAVPAALSLAVLALGVKEEPAAPAAAARERPAPDAPLPPAFWRAAGVIFFFTLAASSDAFLLLKAREVGIAPAFLPLVWSYANGVKSLLNTWGGALSDRFGRKALLLAAWLLYAACYAGFALVARPAALVALIGIYSIYGALSEGTERALVADLVPAESRGRAFGWLHGLTGFAALPASAVFGLLWQRFGSASAFFTGAAIALVAAVALAAAVRPQR